MYTKRVAFQRKVYMQRQHYSCFAGAECTRPTILAVQICSGTPLTFEMPIPCQCHCMLALCFYEPHLLIFHPCIECG
ncbi:unnamed protein product [Ixodes pacificus]